MKRNIAQLTTRHYDLLVVGGGIQGAAIAWDAAQRGLSVAIIEKGDFGGATSANSLKTVHGGLRYLQDANLPLVREMIGERKALLRIAPHLVHPLPVLMPTYKKFTKSALAMRVALTANDMIGFDRNKEQDPQKYLPHGRVLSRQECLDRLPGIAADGITGGALWYDGQLYNSERVLLAFVAAAVQAGADAANYVEASGFLRRGTQIIGVQARDVLSGASLEIRARLVVNAAGVWTDRLLALLGERHPTNDVKFNVSTAWNIVTRQFVKGCAAGITSRYTLPGSTEHASRVLFVAPWRSFSIVGTIHEPYSGAPEAFAISEDKLQRFLDEVNQAYPGAALTRDDVYFIHKGFLPAKKRADANVKLVRDGQIHDHMSDYGLEGLMSVVGVKYTSARKVAQHTVDLAFKKLQRTSPPCRTHVTPLHGGQIAHFRDFLAQETFRRPRGLDPDLVRHLIYNYGSEYTQVLRHLDEDRAMAERIDEQQPVLKAAVRYAVREEMALKLADVVFRRTELGSAGNPGVAALMECAAVMADELGWDEATTQRELADVHTLFAQHSARPATAPTRDHAPAAAEAVAQPAFVEMGR